MIDIYDESNEEEYVQLILDSVFPYWRSVSSAFATTDAYFDWIDRKFEDALDLIDFDEINPPTHH